MKQYFSRKQQIYLPITEIHIELHWQDKGAKSIVTLENVQDLAWFLTDNPELGKAVEYVPKKRPSNKIELPEPFYDLNEFDKKLWLFRVKDIIKEGGYGFYDGHRFDDYNLLEKYVNLHCMAMKNNISSRNA